MPTGGRGPARAAAHSATTSNSRAVSSIGPMPAFPRFDRPPPWPADCAQSVRSAGAGSGVRSTMAPFTATLFGTIWQQAPSPIDTALKTRRGPAPLIERLNRELARALATDQAKAWFRGQGATVLGGTPADFAKRIEMDYQRWGDVIRAAGIKAE
jgi:hypothetical protein